MRLPRTHLLALLVATLVALPAQTFARTRFLCHMTGEVSSSCCCAGTKASETHEAQAKRQDCCELVQVHAGARNAATRASLNDVPAAPLAEMLALEVAPLAPATVARAPNAAFTFQHPPGPPLFLAHCSFLI
jgi:hypothetical protein